MSLSLHSTCYDACFVASSTSPPLPSCIPLSLLSRQFPYRTPFPLSMYAVVCLSLILARAIMRYCLSFSHPSTCYDTLLSLTLLCHLTLLCPLLSPPCMLCYIVFCLLATGRKRGTVVHPDAGRAGAVSQPGCRSVRLHE